ncbi:MAG: HisA/HisF-related TIM barrel protein [Candidatus Thiodiazotropha sp.]
MKLIPVIDLLNARVVTAVSGKRHAYVPSNTPLCDSSQLREVLSALLNLYPFDTLYIADLDAISKKGSNLQLIRSLCHDFPDISFWVDNGLSDLQQLCEFARPIIGSESLVSYQQFVHLIASLPQPILSLDYVNDRFDGPASLEYKFDSWPDDIIVMSLSRVGMACGPDLTRLKAFTKQLPESRFYAAGGVRNLQDLELLHSIGSAGVLLSTALHQRAIDATEIDRLINSQHA